MPWRLLADRLDDAVFWAVMCEGGGAVYAVPRALGQAARMLNDAGFDRSRLAGQVLDRCRVIDVDLRQPHSPGTPWA